MSVEKIFTLPVLISQFRRNSKKQQEYIKDTLAIDIREIRKDNDNTLTEKDFKKIFRYYGSAVPSVLGEGYCLLRGKNMTYDERYRLTYMGALTGLFDDMFDEKDTDESHIKKLVNNPSESVAANCHEKLFIRFYEKVLETGNSDLVKESLNKVFNAQVLSKKQKAPGIKKEDIRYITLEKGGTSLLFYRCAFPEPVSESESRMLYHLGGLGQLENDIFDIYKDYQENIRTLATTATRVCNLRADYESLMHDVFKMVNQTDYPPGNRKRFSRFISLVSSRGLVCLDHLQKLEILSNGIFDIPSYSRENLICDMEKSGNHLKLIRYYLKNN